MTETLGVIGVGHLAGYMVRGLRRQGRATPIVLSPRGAEQTARLAAENGCRVAASNQAVAEAAETLLLTVRPNDAVAVLEGLKLSPRHLVISACAGVKLSDLTAAAGPAGVTRIMPISCAEIGESPTTVFPPSDRAEAMLAPLGSLIPVPSEQLLEAASVNAAAYGWFIALAERMVALNVSAGLDPETARQIVLRTQRGAAGLGLESPEEPLAEILGGLITNKGITAQGLSILQAEDAFKPWDHAFEAVLARLTAES